MANYRARPKYEEESGLYVIDVEGVGTTQAESKDKIMAEVVDFIALSTGDKDPGIIVYPL